MKSIVSNFLKQLKHAWGTSLGDWMSREALLKLIKVRLIESDSLSQAHWDILIELDPLFSNYWGSLRMAALVMQPYGSSLVEPQKAITNFEVL